MGFICCLNDGADLDFSTVSRNRECIVQFKIGFDDETGSRYSLVTDLSPTPGGNPGEFEQVFFVAEYSTDGDEIYNYYDGLETRPFIKSRPDRQRILDGLCIATGILIDMVKPLIVSGCSYKPNLPNEAIRKHRVVLKTYSKHGYKVGFADPYHGHLIWMARKQP